MNTYKGNLPLVSATKFNVSNPTAIAAGTGAYGTATLAGTGDLILGSELIGKGRAILVVVNTSTVANSPTKLKSSLYVADDVNGSTNPAEVTGTTTEWATPAGDTAYTAVINLDGIAIDPAKYYSLALTVNGAGATATVIADSVGLWLDPVYAS